VVGGKGADSHISLLKKGISINFLSSVDDLPLLDEAGIFCCNSYLILKFYGVDSMIAFSPSYNGDSI
jgi:hypothetical protein